MNLMEMTMLLSAHEIVPSILSLEEIHTRPTSDIRTASINAKVDLALRKKIASSFAKIAVRREDRLAVQDLLGSLRFMIHNTALIYSLGLDIEDFPSQQMFRRFRTLSEPTQIIRALKKLKTPEDVPFVDVIFAKTGTEDSQKDQLLRRLLDKSLEVTYSIEWVVAQIVKGRVKGGMLYEQAQYIGGVPVGEYVVEKILDALIGRSIEVDTEEDFLSRASLKRGPKNGTLFYKLFRSAAQRKKREDALDDGDTKIGKGNFSWKNKSRFISNQVGRVNRTMLDLIKKAIEEDKSANVGDQEAFDAVLENVSEAYSDLVTSVYKERTQEDSEDVRQALKEARAVYKAGGASEEQTSDYAHAILDLVTTTQVTLEDLRFLLDNLSLISDDAGNQKKLREIIYDKLFRRGALKSRELVFLDGGYDENTLKKESRSLISRLQAEISAPVSESGVEGDLAKVDNIERATVEMMNVLGTAPEEIYSLRDASYYVASKKVIIALQRSVETIKESHVFLKDNLTEEEEQELSERVLTEDEQELSERIDTLLSAYIPSIERQVKQKRLTPAGEISGGHPLSRYSISDYTPVEGSKSVDIVTPIAGMALKNIERETLSARDLSVANTIQRNLTTEDRQVVEESTDRLKRLLKVISAFNLLKSPDDFEILKDNKKRKLPRDNRIEDVYEILREANFEVLLEEVIEEDTLREKILDFLESDLRKGSLGKKVKSFITHFESAVEDQKENLRQAYRESLGVSINSLMRDAVKENVGDPARRLGSDYYPHTAVADRTSRQVLKALGWDTFVAKTLLGAKKMSDAVTPEVLTAIRAEIIKHSGSDEIFTEVCKKKGFEVTFDAEGVVTPGKNSKNKKLTFGNAKTIMNEASKKLRVSNSYFDDAMSKTEEEIEETIRTKYEEISSQLDSDTIRVFDSFTRNMANGFVQRATEDQTVLSEMLDEDLNILLRALDEGRQEQIEGLGSKPSNKKIDKINKEFDARKEELTKELDALKKSITELRSAYIHSTIVTFEDRVKKEQKEAYEAEVVRITKELDAKIEELQKTDTEEAREELNDIESGVHEIQIKRGRKKKEYQDNLREALSLERRERAVFENYRYAPAVEAEEEAIMESYNKVVEAGISAIVALEATGVGENLGVGANILTRVNDLSVANRSNAIRKINALRNKYPSESRTFFPVYNKTREAQVDRIIDLIQKDPSSFPSVSEDAYQRGLLFSFLKTPYPEGNSVSLVDQEGRAYPYPKPNVFSDVGFSVHLQSFFRNLVGSTHPDIQTEDEYEDFRDGYSSTPQGKTISDIDEISYRLDNAKSYFENLISDGSITQGEVDDPSTISNEKLREEVTKKVNARSTASEKLSYNEDWVTVQALGKGANYLDEPLRETLREDIRTGSQWQGLFGGTNSITFTPYKNTLNNYKGLLADLNLLMFLTSDVVDESESAQVGVNPNTVASLAEIYNMSEEEIEAMVRADFEKEVEDL